MSLDLMRVLTVAKKSGFDVFVASGGREAVSIFRKHGRSIDCVLLDLSMPDMDGRETFAALTELDPQVRVVLSTGFGDQDDLQMPGTSHQPGGALNKPYRMTARIDMIEEVTRSSDS